MTDAWVGAVASLAGVTVGAITTYLTQERQWRRTTRRDVYADYVGKSNICHEELMNVRSTIKRKVTESGNPNRWEGDLKTRWDAANKRMAETSALKDQLSLIATERTKTAAADLESHLRVLKAELDRYNKGKETRKVPEDYEIYRDRYTSAREEFIAAAAREIGIARTRRSVISKLSTRHQ